MISRFRNIAFVVAAVACLSHPSPAFPGPTVPYRESCDGTITNLLPPNPPAPGRLDYIGRGVATHLGKYTTVGGHDFTADGKLQGTFIKTAADGSTISGTYSGTFAPLGGTLFQFNVTAVWANGTGRLAGVNGSASVVSVLDIATGKYHYDGAGTWMMP